MLNQTIEIIKKIREGEEGAVFNWLYNNVLPIVKRYVTTNSGSSQDAEDIFQETIFILIKYVRAGKWDENQDIKGFMLAVSRNLWINKTSKKEWKTTFPIGDPHAKMVAEMPLDVEHHLITDERKRFVLELMNQVGDRCRELLVCIIYEDMSMKEVAAQMQFASDDVAKTMYYKCKKKLQGLVKESEAVYTMLNMND